jgi:hypothetical protein
VVIVGLTIATYSLWVLGVVGKRPEVAEARSSLTQLYSQAQRTMIPGQRVTKLDDLKKGGADLSFLEGEYYCESDVSIDITRRGDSRLLSGKISMKGDEKRPTIVMECPSLKLSVTPSSIFDRGEEFRR